MKEPAKKTVQPNQPEKYAFNLTLEQSDVIVQGLGKLPFEVSDPVIHSLRLQFAAIVQGIEAEKKKEAKPPYKKNPSKKKKSR